MTRQTDLKTGRPGLYGGDDQRQLCGYALCQTSQVHPLPANVSFAQGAALGVPYATAYRALMDRAQALPGETVLIHGASGGVGLASVQLARARGLKVLATAGSEDGRALVLAQGAQAVFDHGATDYVEKILKETDRRGVDIVLEMFSKNQNRERIWTLLAARAVA